MKLVPVAYLGSYFTSVLGNSIAAVALPLIVLQTTGSVLGTGAVAVATAVPAVLAGLLMGVVIDRINRRTSSVVTDLISAAAIAALPVVDLVTGLEIGWFILFGVLGSLGDVPGLTAREALLPAVLRQSGVAAERLVGLREGLGAVAMLVGPAMAGTLIAFFDGATVLWVTAATSLLAALLTLLIPSRVGAVDAPQAGAPVRAPSSWRQLREGWRVLFGDRFLLSTTVLGVLAVVVVASLQGLVLPVYFTAVERPELLGLVLSALAAGALVGSAGYAVVGTRGRRRVWFVIGLCGTAVGFAVVATLASVWTVLAGALVLGLANGLFSSLVGVLMVERVPESMRGRIMGTQNAMITAAAPAGIGLAAVVTELTGVQVAAVVVTGLWLVGLLIGLTARSLRDLDPRESVVTPQPEAVGEGA